MTPLQYLCRRLEDMTRSAAVALEAALALAAPPDDDLPIGPCQQARLLLRVDRLADAVEALADELALLVPDWPSETPTPPPAASDPP